MDVNTPRMPRDGHEERRPRSFIASDVPWETARIPGGVWRRFDAVVAFGDPGSGADGQCAPNLKVYGEGWPPPVRHRLPAGKYTFKIVVSGDNFDASYWELDFEFKPRPVIATSDLRDQIDGVRIRRASPSS